MKSSITTSANFNSNKNFDIQSNPNLVDLYHKHHDEPDFDCEFLHGISNHDEENENIIDPEDDDFADLYDDNQWDADIYDPYLELAYF